MRIVPDEGPLDAPLILIGEAPGRNEEEQGRPFVGASGARLSDWWGQVGLHRKDFYITNLWPSRPLGNEIGKIRQDHLELASSQLHTRLSRLTHPHPIFVPTGQIALRGMMRWKGPFIDRPGSRMKGPSIESYRGSILSYLTDDDRVRGKMIPTRHPAATFRQPGLIPRCLSDWRRIAGDLQFPEDLRIPSRSTHVVQTLMDLGNLVNDIKGPYRDTPISIDIETSPSQGEILCLGFSMSPGGSFVIPTTIEDWGTHQDYEAAIWWIRQLCEGPNEKILQNGHYDAYWLERKWGIHLNHWKWDTLAMHHCLYPREDRHDLAYLTSLYTREPFYKDEGKEPGEEGQWVRSKESLYAYNGKDTACTWEIYQVLRGELSARGWEDLYHLHYSSLLGPIQDTDCHGIRCDRGALNRGHVELSLRLLRGRGALRSEAGRDLWGKVKVSQHKLKKFLYGGPPEGLGLPPTRSKATGNETTDETTLRRIQLRYPDSQASRVSAIVLDLQRTATLLTFNDSRVLDEDDRLRCQYRFTTETLRLASRKNPMGRGRNLQNIDRKSRETFLPDQPGQVLLEVDLSQAESRIVYSLSGDQELIRRAALPPNEWDEHTHNASRNFGVPPEGVTKEMRTLTKAFTHGAQRGLGGEKLAAQILKDSKGEIIRTPEECDGFIRRYLADNPGITDYFREVRMVLMRDRKLTSSWRIEWEVGWDRFDDELYRKAYSWLPQHEVGRLLNLYGFVALSNWLRENQFDRYIGGPPKINLQVHDSLVISCWPEQVWYVSNYLNHHLSQPREYRLSPTHPPVTLRMPCEFKIGSRWRGEREWKVLPSYGEMTDAAHEIVRT